MDGLLNLTEMTAGEFSLALVVVFFAGMVRGFAGFALSALVMAALVVIIPPVQLIVICWFLEMSASLLMVKSGFREADLKVVFGLFVGSTVGTPIGLYFTNTLPIETSKKIALFLVLGLAVAQLLKFRPAFLATTPGLYLSGLTAGIVTGLASIGGMIVALYVLARDAPAKMMRASLVMFLFAGSLTSFIYMYLYGMINEINVVRGLVLAVPCILGVWAGKLMFRPNLEPYYKPFCLSLLVFLALMGFVRMGLS